MRDRFIGAAGMLWGGFLLRQAYLQRGQTPLGVAQAVSLVFAALSEPSLGNPSKAEAKD